MIFRSLNRLQHRAVALQRVFVLLALACAGCVNLHVDERAIVLDRARGPIEVLAPCGGSLPHAPIAADLALDPDAISLITWNIHKNADAGWDSDLSLFVASHALVLLQEVHIEPAITDLLEASGHQWMLASAFGLAGRDTGVMTASVVPPASACVLRQREPLLRLPKSAIVSRYRLHGRDDTLAVANIHSINFALAHGAYEAQLADVVAELAGHQGPIVFAGDLNTWTAGRKAVLEILAGRLGLKEVPLARDTRKRFLGNQVDYVFVRGLDVINARVIEVDSSDHNPVSATLRIP
ncbi:MAG: endonuclease/exonuclease/phosphatase family protein [Burkholderiales bacterium]